MGTEFDDFDDAAREAERAVEDERERLIGEAGRLDGLLKVIDRARALAGENESLRDENASLQRQLEDERRRRAELEMKMTEMGKLSAGVAKKTSHEELLKALRTYVNTSKRKSLSKRTAIKVMLMELANTVGIVFPEDLAAAIDTLDDEQPDPKVVTVKGNYNDIHDNGGVNIKK